MDKRHSKLYVNKIDKKLNNNANTFYSRYNVIKENAQGKKDIPSFNLNDGISIEAKINKMLNSSNFVYKMKAKLLMKDGKIITKEIIGKVGKKLLTMDADSILIDDIRGIDY